MDISVDIKRKDCTFLSNGCIIRKRGCPCTVYTEKRTRRKEISWSKGIRMSENRNRIHLIIIMLVDMGAILCASLTANFIRHRQLGWHIGRVDDSTIFLYMILIYIVVTFLRNAKKDFFRRGYYEELIDVIKGVTIYGLILIASMYIGKMSAEFSRLMIGYLYFLLILYAWIGRTAFKYFMKQRKLLSFYTKRLVIVTYMNDVREVLERLREESTWNYKLKGLILLDAPDRLIEDEFCGFPVMGNQQVMFECLTQRVVDEVFLYLPRRPEMSVEKIIEVYEAMGLAVNLNIDVFDMDISHRNKELRQMGTCYAITFRQSVGDLKMRVIKRVMDICGALVGLLITGVITVFLAPVLLLESPGPLFFTQTRVGLNGRRFKIYKFRSMYRDAEERKKELMKQNEMKGLMFKVEDDPRITKVGKFIRKTSIDELPQFWNVLKGDVSMIGTRPPTEDEFEQYKLEYKRRLSIRPGITGLWQATGRSDITDFEEVLALDLEYIDNWSISRDIKILFLTIFSVVKGRGAK